MEIKFEITEEDFVNFNLHHAQNSPSQKKSYNLSRYLAPLLLSVFIYSTGTSLFKQPQTYWATIAILFIVVWIVSYPKQYKKLIQKQMKKMLQEGDNSNIFGEKTMVIGENNIEVLGESSSEIISKESIKNVKLYDDMILIYLSSVTAQIVPTRYLDEESKKYLMRELNKKD